MEDWDDNVRGPKMSKNTGEVIYKYQMPVMEEFVMNLPAHAEIIRIDAENGMLWMWAKVNTNNKKEQRLIRAFKTGGTIPAHEKKMVYLGCAPIYIQAELMLYFFEVMR